jgi:ABC transport system ATP-binding/permease protein
MALLISCNSLAKSFGSRTLFENISLGISEGERLGLIGPNGAGKSTLLKILSGQLDPDSGTISLRRNTRVGYVPQETEFPAGKTAAQVIAEAIAGERLDDLERAGRINLTLGRAGFADGSVRADSLSGGWGRRLAIARELALQPEVLFLDEPTNHLDLEGILWLEKQLAAAPFASVVVSHDRYFLDNVVNVMAEIDKVYPEGIFRVTGSYSDFLEKKGDFLRAQSSRQEALANIVRREMEWLRRGPKARTGKSKARIDEAGRLIKDLSDLETRSVKAVTQIDFTATDRRTKRLVSVESISRQLGGRTLFAISASSCRRARDWACSAATAPERLRCSVCWPANRSPMPAASSARRRCASSTSIRRANSSIARRPCAKAWARTAITSFIRTGRSTWLAGRSAFCSIRRSSTGRLRASPAGNRRAC